LHRENDKTFAKLVTSADLLVLFFFFHRNVILGLAI